MGRWTGLWRIAGFACLSLCMALGDAVVAAPPAPADGGDIVVRGEDQHRTVADIVKDFTAAAPGEQVAYWNKWLCVRVDGLISPQAVFLRKRIEDNLRSAGLHILSKQDCRADIDLVFPPDSDLYTQNFVKQNPTLYRDPEKQGMPPPGMVDQLLKPRAVRWLAVKRNVSVGSTSSDTDPHIIGLTGASHMVLNSGALKLGEFFVIDYRRLHNVTWNQLADYVSMVVLTDPDMDTDYSHDSSILALFASPDDGSRAPPEMTDRDHLIVKGFGKMSARAMPFAQRDAIAHTVKAEEQAPAR